MTLPGRRRSGPTSGAWRTDSQPRNSARGTGLPHVSLPGGGGGGAEPRRAPDVTNAATAPGLDAIAPAAKHCCLDVVASSQAVERRLFPDWHDIMARDSADCPLPLDPCGACAEAIRSDTLVSAAQHARGSRHESDAGEPNSPKAGRG